MPARTLIGLTILLLATLLVVAQLVVPGIGEGQIEDRLTEGGGKAEVTLAATPAARLLFGDGDRLQIRGSGLDLDLITEDPEVFDRLDGFDEVDVSLDDFRAGPLDVASFELSREGDGPYSLRSESVTTPAELVDYGADALGLAGGSVLGFFADRTRLGTRSIPVTLEMEMASEDGRVRVLSGGGTVAGYPTGPLAEFLTAAILARL